MKLKKYIPLSKTFPRKAKKILYVNIRVKVKNHKYTVIPYKLRETNDGAMFRANSKKKTTMT